MTDKLIPKLIEIKNKEIKSGPMHVQLNITTKCNSRCIYCYCHSALMKDNIRPLNLDFGRYKKIINECKKLGVEGVTISADGEPFLHPNIYDMINYAKKQNMKIDLLTNGTIEVKEKEMKKIDKIILNVSSPYGKFYKNMQKNNLFPVLLKNFKKIQEIKNTYSKPEFVIRMMLNKMNFNQIEDMANFASKYGVDYVQFKLFKAIKETRKIMLTESYAKKMMPSIKKIMKNEKIENNAIDIYRIITSGGFSKFNEIDYFQNVGVGEEDFRCFIAWFEMFVDIDGSVFPCQENKNFLVGNAFKSPIEKIWFSRKFSEFRNKAINCFDTRDKMWKGCLRCPYSNFFIKIIEIMKKMK